MGRPGNLSGREGLASLRKRTDGEAHGSSLASCAWSGWNPTSVFLGTAREFVSNVNLATSLPQVPLQWFSISSRVKSQSLPGPRGSHTLVHPPPPHPPRNSQLNLLTCPAFLLTHRDCHFPPKCRHAFLPWRLLLPLCKVFPPHLLISGPSSPLPGSPPRPPHAAPAHVC